MKQHKNIRQQITEAVERARNYYCKAGRNSNAIFDGWQFMFEYEDDFDGLQDLTHFHIKPPKKLRGRLMPVRATANHGAEANIEPFVELVLAMWSHARMLEAQTSV